MKSFVDEIRLIHSYVPYDDDNNSEKKCKIDNLVAKYNSKDHRDEILIEKIRKHHIQCYNKLVFGKIDKSKIPHDCIAYILQYNFNFIVC